MRRRGAVGLLAVTLTATLAACGGLPTPSGVHVDHKVDADTGYVAPDIRRLAAPPVHDAAPEKIVRDFLEASAGEESDPSVAREFIAPGTAWDPTAQTVVYQPDQSGITTRYQPAKRAVLVTLRQTAVVDTDGAYRQSATTAHLNVGVTRIGGQWRVSSMPAGTGMVLTETDVRRDFREVTAYRVARGRDSLVPEVVELPVTQAALAGAVVRTVMARPSAWLEPAVRSVLPAGTHLTDSVTLVGGDVAVDLSREAAALSDGDRDLFMAQLAASLAQVPSVERIRLTVEGRRALSGDGTVTVSGYPMPPTPGQPDGGKVVVRGGQLVSGVDLPGGRARLTGAAAALGGARGLIGAALSGDGRIAALGVTPTGPQLLVAAAGGRPRVAVGAADLTAPTWVSGLGFLVGVRGSPARMKVVLASGRVLTARLGSFGSLPGPLWGVRASADGSRVAVVTGPLGRRSLYLGSIGVTDGVPTLGGWSRLTLPPAMTDVSAVGWQEGLELAVLGRQGQRAVVWTIPLSASDPVQVTPNRLPADVTVLTVTPGAPMLVGDGARLWSLEDDVWQPAAQATDALYTR